MRQWEQRAICRHRHGPKFRPCYSPARVYFLNDFETESDPNLGSSGRRQLKPDALLGSSTNDL